MNIYKIFNLVVFNLSVRCDFYQAFLLLFS